MGNIKLQQSNMRVRVCVCATTFAIRTRGVCINKF